MASLFSLTGQTALVTGASRGLGQAIAVALAEAGEFGFVAFAAAVLQGLLELQLASFLAPLVPVPSIQFGQPTHDDLGGLGLIGLLKI